jgi:hypothetical protein
MAKIEFELRDCNGIDTNIGDIINIMLPAIERRDRYEDMSFYRPKIELTA